MENYEKNLHKLLEEEAPKIESSFKKYFEQEIEIHDFILAAIEEMTGLRHRIRYDFIDGVIKGLPLEIQKGISKEKLDKLPSYGNGFSHSDFGSGWVYNPGFSLFEKPGSTFIFFDPKKCYKTNLKSARYDLALASLTRFLYLKLMKKETPELNEINLTYLDKQLGQWHSSYPLYGLHGIIRNEKEQDGNVQAAQREFKLNLNAILEMQEPINLLSEQKNIKKRLEEIKVKRMNFNFVYWLEFIEKLIPGKRLMEKVVDWKLTRIFAEQIKNEEERD